MKVNKIVSSKADLNYSRTYQYRIFFNLHYDKIVKTSIDK